MKKSFALLLALVMSICLVACSNAAETGGNNNPQGDTGESGSDITIGIFVKDNTNPFWRYVVSGAMQAGEDLGIEVVEYTPAVAQNVEQQVSLMQDAIQSGIDGIAVCAIDSDSLMDSCKQAMEAGIVVVPFNSRMDELGCETFVGIDNYEAQMLIMEELYEQLGGEGKVVILEGNLGGYVNNVRMEAITDFLEEHPSLEVVADQSGDGQRELTMTVMENILQSCDEIDAVICHNDNMAMGAYQAILAADRVGEMIITGFDAQEECILSMIEDDPPRVDITVDQAPYSQGYLSVEAAYKLIMGEEVDAEIPTGGTIVTPENAQEVYDNFYTVR